MAHLQDRNEYSGVPEYTLPVLFSCLLVGVEKHPLKAVYSLRLYFRHFNISMAPGRPADAIVNESVARRGSLVVHLALTTMQS
jgi:hypothetical protein